MDIQLPKDVEEIIGTIENAGYEAYAVGGCVRDSILKKTPDDWDITTSALPEQIKQLFKRTIDTGIKHGTVTVMKDKTGYEVTTYRIDGEYKDGRHPESVEFSKSLKDDLKRRDFTINAMAYSNSEGLIDIFEGENDIKSKVIRCVGSPKERFTEDALRMMRAIRFSAQLGFDIDKNTNDAIKQMASSIIQVSKERIQVELSKTIMSDNPNYVEKYYETGIFKYVLPMLDDMFEQMYVGQTLVLMKKMPKKLVLRYAALLGNLSPQNAESILRSLKLDNYTVDTVTKLVACSKEKIECNETVIRKAMHKYGVEMVKLMMEYEDAAMKAREEFMGISQAGRRRNYTVVKRLLDEIIDRGDCVSVKELDITGNDLMELGMKGRQIGIALDKLLQMVLENPKLNDKDTLLAIIDKNEEFSV